MTMQPFAYERAASVEDAIAGLARVGGDATHTRPLAGGTDLLTLMKADVFAPARLIDVKRAAGLDSGIAATDGGVTVGALATLADLERHPLLVGPYLALSEAAGSAASPQLRNVATVGGNLLQRPRCWYFRNLRTPCWLKGGDGCPARDGENQHHAIFDTRRDDHPCVAVHPSDPAAALLALDAEVTLRGPGSERTLPLAAFFASPTDERRLETTLLPDELLLSIRLPAPPPGARSVYRKAMDRKVWAFALVGVAARVNLDGGRIADARLILSGVANVPRRATAAEAVLDGAAPDDELFARAADAALADAAPLSRNAYKVPLAKALIRGALADAAGMGT